MKSSLSWHEEALKNFNSSLAGYQRQLSELSEKVKLMTIEANFRKAQIEEARKLGRDSFDDEKFMSNKNPLRRKL